MTFLHGKLLAATFGFLFFASLGSLAGAQTTYTKANNTTALDQAASWSPSGVPGSSDTALWNGTYTNGSVSVGAGLSAEKIQLTSPSQAITINAGTGAINLTGSSGTGIDLSAATENLTINAPVTLGLSQSWAVASGRTLTVNGAIGDAGAGRSLTASGTTGTIVLGGTNTFSGGLNITPPPGGMQVYRFGGNNSSAYVKLNPNATIGNVTVNGRLDILGAATVGTIGGSGSAGYISNLSTTNNSLTFAGGSSFSMFNIAVDNARATLQQSGSGGVLFSYFGYNTSTPNAQTTFSGGTWTLNQIGQNNTGAQCSGAFNITGSASVNIPTATSFSHGTWNVNNGTLQFGGSVGETNGSSTGTNTSLVLGVNNSGGGPGLISINGSMTLADGGAASNANSLTVGSGGTATMTNLTLGSTTARTAETDTVNLQSGGKLFANGAISAAAATTGQTRTFNWTGGQLTAATVNPGSGFAAPGGGGIGGTTLVQNGGTLAPGDIGYSGRTTIAANYTITSGTLAIEISGTTASSAFQDSASGNYDNVSVTGTATLGGNLSVSFANGYFPKPEDSFTILSGSAISGTFQNVQWGTRMLTTDGLGSFIPSLEGNVVVLRYFDWHGSAPQITTQPQSDIVLAGKPATFSVQVTGNPPFNYQWYKSGAAITTGTLPWLTIGNTAAADAASYFVVVSNTSGAVTSGTVTLTVNPASSAFDQMLYRMDQTPVYGTSAINDAFGTTAGTLLNTPTPIVISGANANTGNAWDFSQSSAYIQVAANSFLDKLGDILQTTGMTVGFWVNIDYQGGGSMNNSQVFGLGSVAGASTPNASDAQLIFSFGSGASLSTSTTQLDGNWHYMVATLDFQKQSNNAVLYVDGVAYSTKTYPVAASFSAPGTNLGIGALNNGFHSWAGQLDEFFILDRALVAGEVTSLYTTGTISSAAPLVVLGADSNTIQSSGTCSTGIHATVTPLVSGTWTKTSGPAATIAATTSANTTVTLSGTGTYVFRYTATSAGLTNFGETVIKVVANQGPVITSCASSFTTISDAAANRIVNLSARVTDDGLPNPPGMLTSTWSQSSGPAAVTISYPDLWETPVVIPAQVGTYVLQFSVTDGVATSSSTVTINVVNNLGPSATANADAHTITWNGSGVSTTLRGVLADDGRPVSPSLLSGSWSQVSGPATATIATPSGSAANSGSLAVNSGVSLPAIGQYVFRFNGSDGALATSATTWATVWAPGALSVVAGVSRCAWLPNATLLLQGTCTATGPATYQWSVDRGPGAVSFSNPTSLATNATFTVAGKYRLLLTASSGGYTGQDDMIVEVYNSATQNFGYSLSDLNTYFTGAAPIKYNFTDLAWSRIAPPPPPYVHPRILFNPDDLPGLRNRLTVGTTCGPVIMNSIRTNAANLTAYGAKWRAAFDAMAAGDLTLFNASSFDRNGFTSALAYESFRALIDNDTTGGAKLGAATATLADYLYQTLPVGSGTNDYRASIQGPCYTDTLGWTYDFAYNFMTADQQNSVRRFLSLVVNKEWNVGLDALPGYQGNNSNWIPLTGQTLLTDLLAIEGETGWDPDLLLRYEALYDRLCDSLAHPDGALYEGMGKGWIGIQTYFALAKRGSIGIASETVRNHIRQFYLHCMETAGYGWTWEEVIGGSNGGAKFADVTVMKFLYPTDPIIDFMYRNACGLGYTNSGNFTSASILTAICAQDYNSSGLTWDQAAAQQITPNAPLTQLFNMHGLFAARSDWSSNGMRLLFQPRAEPGGHSIPDRNCIVLSGQGRIWIPWDIYGSGSGYLPGDNSMAANVVRVDDVGSSTVPAKMVDYLDTPNFTYAVGDAKDCYSKAFGGTTTPVSYTTNDKLLSPIPEPWANLQAAYQPNWYTSLSGTSYWQNTRNNMRAFRTACLIRGGTAAPYSVIVDDIQMDSAVHNYKWRAMLANDLTNVTVNGTDAIITSGTSGNVSMLVRLLSCSGSAHFVNNPPNTYTWFSWPWIDIEVNAVAPDFKVLLLPYVNGTPLPTTTWHGNVLDVAWSGGQVDHLLFAPNADGRTRVSFSRNPLDTTPPVLTVPANIVTTATTAQGNVVTFNATATDNTDGAVPVTFSPASGSIFPIGVTTVKCSANDSSLNGSGTSFTVTVQPGSFTLTAPALTAQTGNSSASLAWSSVAPASSYNIKRSLTSGTGYAIVASGVTGTRYVDTSLANGTTYYYMVSASNGMGEGPNSNQVNVVPATLSAPWSVQNIGSAGLTGTATIAASGSASMTAAGSGFGGATDSFFFASQPWVGDGTVVARVNSFQNATNSSRGGVMFRSGTANNTAFGFVGCQYYASDYGFYSRASSGASVVAGAGTHSSLPQWFKLVRSGSNVTAYQASNSSPGVQPWHQVGSAQIALSGTIYAGLAVYSSSTNSLCTVNFDSFAIYTPPTITQPSNITLEATSSAGAFASFVVSGSSNVNGIIPAVCTPASGTVFPIGTTTVTAVVTDGAAQSSTATFTVTVRDTTSPVITVPADISVNATTATGAVVNFTTSATDLVGGSVSTSNTPPSGSLFPIGTTLVTAQATDAAGNTATRTFNVTVTVPPIAPAEKNAPGIAISGSNINLTIYNSVPGRTYQVQRSANIQLGNWIDIGTLQTGTGADLILSVPYNSTAPKQFYRLKLGP